MSMTNRILLGIILAGASPPAWSYTQHVSIWDQTDTIPLGTAGNPLATSTSGYPTQVNSGPIAATGDGAVYFYPARGSYFNYKLSGAFVATCQLERSFNAGSTWQVKTVGGSSAPYVFTAAASETDYEPEGGVYYRINCTSYTSGTINVRFGQ